MQEHWIKMEIVKELLDLRHVYIQRDNSTKNKDGHYYIIMDNDASARNGTLTSVEICGGHIINRYKMYNKVYAQCSSPGVANTTGNHLHDVMACPDERLKDTLSSPRAKERGITRLEISMYRSTTPSTREMEE